ncbi:unnamed protein product, partial [Prorocentrum cordatum]
LLELRGLHAVPELLREGPEVPVLRHQSSRLPAEARAAAELPVPRKGPLPAADQAPGRGHLVLRLARLLGEARE